MFLTGFKPMNDGCTAYSYSADRQQFFCPHQHCAKMGAGDMKKGKSKVHLLILWGSFSEDMTITGIGFRELIA
jgi:hypothetical protein